MRLPGRNVVKVLAMILMLVYSKLVFTVFTVLHYAVLYAYNPNGTLKSKLVWYFDGNVPYLGTKHAPLFVVAFICSIAMLFFVFSLLLIQCLQKRSSLWFLRWVVRLRPFYEAYTGPCHDNYRFWPGFLILIRTGLYTMNSSFTADTDSSSRIKMLITVAVCIVVMSLACIFPYGVYKRWPLNVLEFSFLLNLCITSGFLGITHHGYQKSKAIYTSMSITVLTFLGILIYHFHGQTKYTRGWKKITKWFSVQAKKMRTHRQRQVQKSEEIEGSGHKLTMLLLPQELPPVVHFDRCREPLVEV